MWEGKVYNCTYIIELGPTQQVQVLRGAPQEPEALHFQLTVMKRNHLLSLSVLLMASGPLLCHPITESAEMPYPGPVSLEDRGVGDMNDLSLSEQTFSPQDVAGLRYSALVAGDINREGVGTAGLLPRAMKRQVLLEKQSLLNPFSHVMGIRKQFRKRTGNNECFWKYCV